MGIENYLLITLVYGIGTYAAYRLGRNHGVISSYRQVILTIAAMSNISPQIVHDGIKAFRQKKLLQQSAK